VILRTGSVVAHADLQHEEVHKRAAFLPGKAHDLASYKRPWVTLCNRLSIHAQEVAAPVGDAEATAGNHEF
jgi:hypothetical protein